MSGHGRHGEHGGKESISRNGEAVKRGNNINLIRLILATVVIWQHACGLQRLQDPFVRLMPGVTSGAIAVDCFFILSGYLILKSRNGNGLFDFLTKRALRIYPAYLVIMLAGGLLAHQALTGRLAWNVLTFNALPEFQSVFAANVNHGWAGTIWTLYWEVACYLFVAAFGPNLLRNKAVCVLVFFATFIAQGLDPSPVSPWRLICYFAAGAMWYRLGLMQYATPTVAVIWGGMLVTAAALAHVEGYKILLTYVMPFALPVIVFYLGFVARPLKYTADDLSYGTYLWGFPIMQALIAWWPMRWEPWALFMATCLLTWPVAYLSWLAIEKPCLRLAHRKSAVQ